MRQLSIKKELLKNTNEFTFENVPTMYDGFTDVYYKGQRIAILNGLSSPLQWAAKNGSNIPNNIIDNLENLTKELILKSM
jgi:hypothetical protein